MSQTTLRFTSHFPRPVLIRALRYPSSSAISAIEPSLRQGRINDFSVNIIKFHVIRMIFIIPFVARMHPVCRHCMKKFIDFYRFRAQDTIVPICDRPDLRMHLRYKSIPGLLLNQALMTELAHHCAYCHCAIAARSIRKHYRDCHAQLLTYESMDKDQVYGLANLGSGRGTCVLCSQACNNLQQHQCGVLMQLSITLGQICDVSHLPIMPVMIRGQIAAESDDPQNQDEPMGQAAHHTEPPQEPEVESGLAFAAQVLEDEQIRPSTGLNCLHKCTQCHMAFLTNAVLVQHVQQTHSSLVESERMPQAHRKICHQMTVQQMLNAPAQELPYAPQKQYECPICQEVVGRKALWTHPRREYQTIK